MASRGYDRDEYEDLDEYDDGYEQEEVVGEDEYEDEYEEEQIHQPTQEELDYLELRQRLKERLRKRMKKDQGSMSSNSRENGSKLPFNDNYGSFFGPSQPVIAQRVIQESKSLLENPQAAAKLFSAHHDNNRKSSNVSSSGSKPRPGGQLRKASNGVKAKVQMIKNTRDYSFLLSDDVDVPPSNKDISFQNPIVQHSEAQPAHVPSRIKQSVGNTSTGSFASREERGYLPTTRMQPKEAGHKFPSGGWLNHVPMDNKRHISSGGGSKPTHSSGHGSKPTHSSGHGSKPTHGSANGSKPTHSSGKPTHSSSKPAHGSGHGSKPTHGSGHGSKPPTYGSGHGSKPTYSIVHGSKPTHSSGHGSKPTDNSGHGSKPTHINSHASGPGRPTGSKPLPSKTPGATMEKKVSAPVAKNSMSSSVHKSMPPARSQPSIAKKPLQQQERQGFINGKMTSKPSLSVSKQQIKRSTENVSSHAAVKENRPKKRPIQEYSDEEDDGAISMIRQMFRYNPNKYRDFDDDSDMEANFDEIQREEARSLKIARREDEEELRKIEEEERRERLRAKKRKMMA